jgi:hypothetical protein
VSRLVLIAILGIAVILAALAINFAIKREDAGDAPPALESGVAPTTTPEQPSAPAEPEAVAGPIKPSFDIVRVRPTGETVIAGRAAPGAVVTITDNGKPLGTAVANSDGEWVFLPAEPLGPGSHELSLSVEQPDGTPLLSEDIVLAVVPEANTDIAGRTASETGEALTMIVPREGAGSVVLQAPSATPDNAGVDSAAPQSGALALDSIDYDEKGRVVIGGRAPVGAEVRVYLDNALIGRAVAGPDGHWSLTPEAPVADGLHRLRVDQVTPSGAVVARVESPFDRAAAAATEAAAPGTVVVQPGNSLWRLARQTYGSGWQFTVIYDANRERIADPDLIYPGQVFELPPAPPAGN